jgi:hypothetical protein
VPGQGQYTWDGEKWTSGTVNTVGAVRYDTSQNLTEAQDAQARSNIYAAPFDAMAYSGLQINGSMEVSQERGTAGTNVNGQYPCDGWKLFFVGTMAVTSAQSSVIAAGFPNSLGMSVQTAQASLGSGDVVQIYQSIEGYRIARLGWGTGVAQAITLAFWSSHHRTGIYSGTIINGAGNRCYAFTYTQTVADNPQYNAVTIPGDTIGTWASDNTAGMRVIFAAAAGSGSTAPSANTWVAGSFSAAPGQINAVASTSDAFRITGVVVLPGIEAPSAERSPLIMRPFDQELVTCKRYYTTFGYAAGMAIIDSYAGSPQNALLYFPIPQMRASPTGLLFGAPTATNITTAGNPGFSTNPFVAYAAWGVPAAGRYMLGANASSGTTFTFDARL